MSVLFLGFVLGLALGLQFDGCRRREVPAVAVSDTVTVTRIDTVRIAEAVERWRTEVRTDTLWVAADSLAIDGRDSVAVALPIERVEYADSSYRAVVSGWNPHLDTIEVYPRVTERTVTTERLVEAPARHKRWGLGLTAGYALTPAGFQPYIGAGVSFNLVTF